jgi:uncharacterized protein (DUF2252 family)
MFTSQPKRELWEPLISIPDRIEKGKQLREKVPRASHAEFPGENERRDPIQLLMQSNQGRVEQLLSIRYGRMLQSPFAFLRGSAIVMANDLFSTPVSGIEVQCCGDCHLMNFGIYATPERNLVFDINDFDETLPAPWEWDLKRLAASFVVAGRYKNFTEKDCRRAVMILTRTYRDKLRKYATMRILDIWYNRLDEISIHEAFKTDKELIKLMDVTIAKARLRIHDHVFPKLSEVVNGRRVIKDEPPLIYHEKDTEERIANTREFFANYRSTLSDDMKSLFDRYQLVDVAMKVVGVGSVGTRCLVGLFVGEENDALFLQFKEARASVLESPTRKSIYQNHGERIVNGQRLLQTVSDIFLGWTKGFEDREFYVRQLKQMNAGSNIESRDLHTFNNYALMCGWALAKSHAKSGGAPEISGYIGKSDELPEAIGQFATQYADQTEKDFAALKVAEKKGLITKTEEVF